MKIELLELKGENCCRYVLIEDKKLISPPLSFKYKLNPSLILLFSFRKKKIFFSYFLAKIFKISSRDYNKYIKNFSNKHSFPSILHDLGIVITKEEEKELKIKQSKFFFRILQLNVTSDCNLRCKYCYASAGRGPQKKDMSFKLAKKSIDYVSKFCGDKLNIIFSGGEPTTKFELIKKVLNYAKEKVKNVRVNPLITNGVFSKRVADWIIKNAYAVQISCDGPSFIQDKYRPLANGGKSSPFVEKTIKYFLKRGKDFRVRATLTDDSFDKEKEIINYFFNLGVKNLYFAPIELVGAAKEISLIPGFQQRKIANKNLFFSEFLKVVELEYEVGINNFSVDLKRVGSSVTCAIYTKDFFVVDPYGNVSACERYSTPFVFKEEPYMRDLMIGKYNSKKGDFEIDFHKLDNLKKIIEKETRVNHCSSCPLSSACGKICLYQIARQTGSISTNKQTCGVVDKKWPTLIFKYLAQRRLIGKKPCIEMRNNKLFYSLFYNKFKLYPQKMSERMKDNPYIYVDSLSKLDLLLQRIIKYKNSRKELTLFLFRFQLSNNEVNLATGKRILSFFENLRENHVYFRISRPLPETLFNYRYKEICSEFNLPQEFSDCLELYIVKGNQVFFPITGKKGNKDFGEYEDREEIYKDFLSSRE